MGQQMGKIDAVIVKKKAQNASKIIKAEKRKTRKTTRIILAKVLKLIK